MFQVTPDNKLVWEFINEYDTLPDWNIEIHSLEQDIT
jgi:hypothetical protein